MRIIYEMTDTDDKDLDDMWRFIESILVPYGLMPKREDLDRDEVLNMYFGLRDADELFRTLAQIAILKKDVDALKGQ